MSEPIRVATLGLASGNGMGVAYLATALDSSNSVKLGEDGLPSDILLWHDGRTKTTKGTFQLTDRSRKLVMEDWQARMGGVVSPTGDGPGSFDYDHDEFNERLPGYEKIGGGWYDLALDGKDIWQTRCGFTARAGGLILAKEKRSTSGAFHFDPKTGEYLSLINVALTNLPATYNQAILCNQRKRGGLGYVLAPPDGPQDECRIIVQVPAIILPAELPEAQQHALTSALDLLGQGKIEDAGRALLGDTPTSKPTSTPTIIDPVPAALVVAPSQVTETASMGTYSDPNFSATQHGYMLRYMASCDMESMMMAIYMNVDLPAMSKAMGLDKYVSALAENVTHCAAAMAECVTSDMGDDDSMDESSLISAVAKLPDDLRAEVEKTMAACKTAKLGGLLQKAHKAALGLVGAKQFDKSGIESLTALGKDLPALRGNEALLKRTMGALSVKSDFEIIPAIVDQQELLNRAKAAALAANTTPPAANIEAACDAAITKLCAGKDPIMSPATAQLAKGLDPVTGQLSGQARWSLAEIDAFEKRHKESRGQLSVHLGAPIIKPPAATTTPTAGPVGPTNTPAVKMSQGDFEVFRAMNPDITDAAKLREAFDASSAMFQARRSAMTE